MWLTYTWFGLAVIVAAGAAHILRYRHIRFNEGAREVTEVVSDRLRHRVCLIGVELQNRRGVTLCSVVTDRVEGVR